MCRHWKAILSFSLTSVCCLLSHSLLLVALQKKVHLESLSTSPCLCLYFPFWHTTQIPDLDRSKGTKGLLSHRLPIRLHQCCQTLENNEFTAQPSDGLQWLWRGCPCLHCHRGQEDDRDEGHLWDLWQCGKTYNRCKWLTAAHICHCSHSYWDRRQMICKWKWNSFVSQNGPYQTQSHLHLVLWVWI